MKPPRRHLRLDEGGISGQKLSMNVQHIRERLTGGFKPFVIRTSDGHEYPVPHPEFILITKRTVVVANRDGFVHNLDPLHIVALNDIPAPPTPK